METLCGILPVTYRIFPQQQRVLTGQFGILAGILLLFLDDVGSRKVVIVFPRAVAFGISFVNPCFAAGQFACVKRDQSSTRGAVERTSFPRIQHILVNSRFRKRRGTIKPKHARRQVFERNLAARRRIRADVFREIFEDGQRLIGSQLHFRCGFVSVVDKRPRLNRPHRLRV